MAPKTALSQAQKIEKFLSFFHQSRTCHTLKDLETNVSSATKINKMHIKDLLKELTDTNQVKVEKIGSGNWYWAWPGEEFKQRTSMHEKLQIEEGALQDSVANLKSQIEIQSSKQVSIKEHPQYDTVVSKVDLLGSEVQALEVDHHEWQLAVANGTDSKRSAIAEYRRQAMMHTDNILTLEAYIQRQLPVSHEEMDNLRQEYYGKLYREGEGLADIDE